MPQNNAASGGVIVNGPFYGFSNYRVNGTDRPYDKIQVTRTTAAGAVVGNWVVEAGSVNAILGNMRHYAAHPTGYYYLDFPTIDDINEFSLSVTNMLTANDYQVVSIEYSGNYNITKLFASTAYNMNEFGSTVPFPTGEANTRAYTAVSNFQAVVSAPTGEVFWHDKINNKVWFKVRGGVNPGEPTYGPTRDFNLYKEFKIRAYGTYAPLSVTSPEDGLTFSKIYPNPTKDIITIEYNASNNEGLNFIISDAVGRELTNIKTNATVGKNLQHLSLNAFPNGVYFVTIKNGNNLNTTRKIIKN